MTKCKSCDHECHCKYNRCQHEYCNCTKCECDKNEKEL